MLRMGSRKGSPFEHVGSPRVRAESAVASLRVYYQAIGMRKGIEKMVHDAIQWVRLRVNHPTVWCAPQKKRLVVFRVREISCHAVG